MFDLIINSKYSEDDLNIDKNNNRNNIIMLTIGHLNVIIQNNNNIEINHSTGDDELKFIMYNYNSCSYDEKNDIFTIQMETATIFIKNIKKVKQNFIPSVLQVEKHWEYII